MLKEIFEHDKCKSLKIYYYKWGNELHENDYVEKTYEISRHFTDKGMMRKKLSLLINLNLCKGFTFEKYRTRNTTHEKWNLERMGLMKNGL